MTKTVKFLLIIVASPFLYVWSGFVLTKLWGWFLVPIGLPMISIPIAIGLSVIYSFFSGRWEEDAVEHLLDKWLFAAFAPAVSLLVGFIVQLFI